jgi:hypothetical protein
MRTLRMVSRREENGRRHRLAHLVTDAADRPTLGQTVSSCHVAWKTHRAEAWPGLAGPAVLVVLLVLDPQVGAVAVGLELHVAVAAPVLAATFLPQVVVAVPCLHAGAVAVVPDREAAVVVAPVAHAVAPVAAAEDVAQDTAVAVPAVVAVIGRGAGGERPGEHERDDEADGRRTGTQPHGSGSPGYGTTFRNGTGTAGVPLPHAVNNPG